MSSLYYIKNLFTTDAEGKLLKGYNYINENYIMTIIGYEWYINGNGTAGTSFLITLKLNN